MSHWIRFGGMALVLITVAGVWACGDSATITASSSSRAMVDMETLPSGDADCPTGGVLINVGEDTNRDGVLDPDEVTESSTICNGADGTSGVNGSDAVSTLASTDEVAPGEDCANGGVRVDVGQDDGDPGGTAGDGVLQPDEVDNSVFACNPVRDSNQLFRITPLEEGDSDCPGGGTRLEAGLDNGDGEGVASDGVLQDGEVDTVDTVCEPLPEVPIPDTAPPEGDPGTYTITLTGGLGDDTEAGVGGDGGILQAYLLQSTLTGNVKLFGTGSASVDITLPPAPSDELLGPVEARLTFETDDTVEALTTGTGASGQVYTRINDTALYLFDGAEEIELTGIRIAPGVTVTLESNFASSGCAPLAAPCAHIELDRGLHLEGTLTLAPGEADDPNLVVTSRLYYGAADSLVDLQINDANGSPGQSFAFVGPEGRFFNAGEIRASGLTGTTGGSGGAINVSAGFGVINTGLLRARGAPGSAVNGGNGGTINLTSQFAYVENSGSLDVSGGAGALVGGGGGGITFLVGSNTDGQHLYNSGDLEASGGSGMVGTTEPVAGGGSGGYFAFSASGADIVLTGALTANGGSSDDGPGGGGGSLTVLALAGQTSGGSETSTTPAGDVTISCPIGLSGAGGDATGGSGGGIALWTAPATLPFAQEIQLLGYASVDLSGGSGVTEGGDGGSLMLLNGPTDSALPTGGVFNTVPITSNGGSATAGAGGSGGDVLFRTGVLSGGQTDLEVIDNLGDMVLNGGDGTTTGGDRASVVFNAANRVNNDGDLSLNGGAATDDGATGGGSGPTGNPAVWISAELGPVDNSGDISVDGGAASAGAGGHAAEIELWGVEVATSGNLTARGGAGDTEGGTGGDGGVIRLTNSDGSMPSNNGTTAVDGGPGFTPGEPGSVIIAGQLQ